MTSLAPNFFDKRAEEIEKWRSKGFVELHDLLKGTDYILEDLEMAGILQQKITLVDLGNLDKHEATPEWQEQFREGGYMTNFLPNDLSDKIMKFLSNHDEVQKRVQHRQEAYRQRKVALDRKKLLEEDKKAAAIRKIEEENLLKNNSLASNTIDEVKGQVPENRDSEKSSHQIRSEAERYSSAALSTTGLVAIPSMLLLSAIMLGYLGSGNSPGPLEWTLIALFSYSPIRYIFRSGIENSAGQLKALVMGTVMFLVVGAGISSCSGVSTSGPSCWYIVGCI